MSRERGHEDGEDLCSFYMSGYCKFGSKCKNAHPVPPLNKAGYLIVCRFDQFAGGCRNILYCPFRHPQHPKRSGFGPSHSDEYPREEYGERSEYRRSSEKNHSYEYQRPDYGENSEYRPSYSRTNNSREYFSRPSSSSRHIEIVTEDNHRPETTGTKRSRSDSGPSKRIRTGCESLSPISSPEKKRSKMKKTKKTSTLKLAISKLIKTKEKKLNKLDDKPPKNSEINENEVSEHETHLLDKLKKSEKKVNELEDQLQQVTNVVNYKNEIIQNNLSKISLKEEKIESLQEEKNQLIKKFEDEQTEKEDLKLKYEKLSVDHEALHESLESKKAELSNLEDDSKATETEKNELHSKIVHQANQLKALEEKLVKVEKEREEMEVERDNFDDENVDFREKIKRLNLQYNKEVEELKGQLGEQVSETKYLRERNAELISSETSLKTSLEGKEAAMKEAFLKNETLKENLKTKKVQIEKEKNILTDKLEKLQSELSSLKSSETRKEGDLVNELKIREIVIAKLKEDLASSEQNAKEALKAASTRENSLQSQLDEYNKSLRSKEAAMTEAFLSIENFKVDREKLLREKTNFTGIREKLESEKSCLESVKDNLTKKVIALEKENSKSKTEMKSLGEKLTDSGSILAASNAERIKVESKVQELQRSVQSLNKQQEETAAEFQKRLEELLSADQVKGVFIESQQETMKSNIEQFKKDIDDMKKELRKKDLQLKSYEEKVLPLLRSQFN